jgi:hypothetical protein
MLHISFPVNTGDFRFQVFRVPVSFVKPYKIGAVAPMAIIAPKPVSEFFLMNSRLENTDFHMTV